MAKKRKKFPKMTPEEHAERDETQRMVRERIAYHEAKAREEDARRAAKGSSWGSRLRRLVPGAR